MLWSEIEDELLHCTSVGRVFHRSATISPMFLSGNLMKRTFNVLFSSVMRSSRAMPFRWCPLLGTDKRMLLPPD